MYFIWEPYLEWIIQDCIVLLHLTDIKKKKKRKKKKEKGKKRISKKLIIIPDEI